MAEAIYATNTAMIAPAMNSEAEALEKYGREHGSNVHFVALIEVRRALLKNAASESERTSALNGLGQALFMLGEREGGRARLEEAVAAFREVLEARPREQVPLQWAEAQTSLGNALMRLGEREGGRAKLEEAVFAFREALKERRQEGVPRHWAETQNGLGNALMRLGERGGGRATLEEAVFAFREALRKDSLSECLLSGQKHKIVSALRCSASVNLKRNRRFPGFAKGREPPARAGGMGHDTDQSRKCVARSWRGRAGRSGRSLSRSLKGRNETAGASSMGADTKWSRHDIREARLTQESKGKA